MRLRTAALALLTLLATAFPAQAQGPKGDVAGRFDYYLLALSWSPTYCADPEAAARDQRQCGLDRRFSFVVHGLWPQYERGFPRSCASTQPANVATPLKMSMLDLMPSPRLVEHQWDKHGVCTGATPQAYFDLTRKLRGRIAIPPAYSAPAKALSVTGAEVEAAFVRANPGLTPAMIAVQCDRQRLREVRICFSKAGAPRACGSDVRDRCGTARVTMPPVRAGAG